MQTESIRIHKLLSRNWNGPMWHGNTIKEVLKDISWEKSFYKPANFSHNIYEYVMHMVCWRRFGLEHLKGNTIYAVEINSETDWVTQYEKTKESWMIALNDLENNQNELLKAFENFSDEKLTELVPGKKFNWYTMIHGLIHHDIYHSAQISILKK
jgi:uncharacterized damage-inducible protein DinB